MRISLKYISALMPLMGSVLGAVIELSSFENASPEPMMPYTKGPSEEGINIVMKQMDSRMTEAIDQSMSQLDDVLFLNGSRYARQLRAQASGFHSRVMLRLKDDLTRIATKTDQKREVDGTLSMDSKIDFADDLRSAWEGTLRSELKAWKQGPLHAWVDRVKSIWHGMEDKIKAKAEKVKEFIHRHSPRHGDA